MLNSMIFKWSSPVGNVKTVSCSHVAMVAETGDSRVAGSETTHARGPILAADVRPTGPVRPGNTPQCQQRYRVNDVNGRPGPLTF